MSNIVQEIEQLKKQIANLQSEVNYSYMTNFLSLPGLRGFWPMSGNSSAGGANDLSGNGLTLTRGDVPLYTVTNSATYVSFDGTNDYLTRTDEAALDVLGTEGYMTPALRGLTCGGWFRITSLASAVTGLITKTDQSTQRSYELVVTATNLLQFRVSSDGAGTGLVGSGTLAASTGEWLFIVGRFDPSAEVGMIVNSTEYNTTSGVPSAVFGSTSPLNIGAYNNGSGPLTGFAAFCFLCVAYLPDEMVSSLYQSTRGLFRV